MAMLPKIAWERWRGKKHPAFFQRLGFSLAKPKGNPVVWLHAVSVGEVKSVSSFFHLLKQEFPKAWICITTTTATGQEEAKRSLPGADVYLYAPLDFTFAVRRFVKTLKPDLFFLVESDFWPNLLNELKKGGCKSFLLSGKISERAASRWKLVPRFAKKLFSCFDLICVQSEEYAKRLSSLVSDPTRIRITGNLKFDMKKQEERDLQIVSDGPFLTISCTHALEEGLLLDRLIPGKWKIFLAPRHPERFDEVARLLEKKNISFVRMSQIQKIYRNNLESREFGKEAPQGFCLERETITERQGLKEDKNFEEKPTSPKTDSSSCLGINQNVQVILVDAMGQLGSCYSKSILAIVGGSFIPHIGGHNVLEPCLYSCPSVFGPYTFAQKELVQKALDANAGIQSPIDQVAESIEKICNNLPEFSSRAQQLMDQMRGATQATWEEISRKI